MIKIGTELKSEENNLRATVINIASNGTYIIKVEGSNNLYYDIVEVNKNNIDEFIAYGKWVYK